MKPVALTLLALALTGCSMAPTYERPPRPCRPPMTPHPVRPAEMPQDWKDYFNDPALRAWIAAALANNRDLRVAALRIEEARALYGVQRADRLPSVDGTAGYSRSRASDPGPSRDAISQQYRAGVGITAFELDFFGRIKSLTDAALERYGQRRGAPRRRAVAGGRNRHGLFQRAFAGRAAAADPQHAGIARDHTDADPAPLRRRPGNRHGPAHRADAGGIVARHAGRTQPRAQPAVHALGLLAGDFRCRPTPTRRRWKARALPAGGRPAVGAADAASGSAPRRTRSRRPTPISARRARPFPSVQLTTDIGSTASSFSDLFGSGSGVWQFAPKLTLPIFNAGQQRQPVAGRNPQAHRGGPVRRQHPDRLPRSGRRAVGARCAAPADRGPAGARRRSRTPAPAERRYARGVTNYLEMLDAQRSLFESEQEFIRLQQRRLVNAVTLYKALGGWEQGSGAS